MFMCRVVFVLKKGVKDEYLPFIEQIRLCIYMYGRLRRGRVKQEDWNSTSICRQETKMVTWERKQSRWMHSTIPIIRMVKGPTIYYEISGVQNEEN